MKRKNPAIVSLAAAAGIAMLGASGTAFADHKHRYYKRASVTTASYANPRRDALYDYARVLSAEPIVRYVTVKTPVRECYEDIEYYTVERHRPGVGASTLIGAVIGGVVGHQFGSGRGNDAATVAGTVVGAAIGNDVGKRRHPRSDLQYSRPVERCTTTMREHEEERIDGYRVVYHYNGQKYSTRMPYDPGREIRVRVDVRPAS
jgi:uncharacterized protein YcfJ